MIRSVMTARAAVFLVPMCVAFPGAGCTTTGSTPDAGPTGGCVFQDECAATEMCAAGKCQAAPSCTVHDDWPTCVALVERVDVVAAQHAWCDVPAETCRIGCLLDTDCSAGKVCTDFGQCVPASPVTAPRPTGARTSLRAGYAATLLDIPIGSPLGGYGGRFDPSPHRYAGGLAASHGQFDGMDARALFLDNGENPLLIIRVPLIFIDMSLHEQVARILETETGKDWRDHLVISATHTHSGPARLWPLPPATVLPLGLLGAGDFSQWFYDHVVRSIADAALQSMASPVAARVGWDIVESFDDDDVISHDRRNETPQFDDNRALLIRVDDDAGVPLAVLFSFGMHGTANEEDFLTGDVNGGAEIGLEEAMGKRWGRYVPAMYMSQNSGTMAPAGGGHDVPQWNEYMGVMVAARTMPALEAITTRADVTLRSRTTRFGMDLEALGYEPGEWQNTEDFPFAGEYRFGAIQCTGSFDPGSDLAAFLPITEHHCFGLHTFGFNRPPTPLTRSQVTALQIDDLGIITAPGELSMELSWLMLRALRDTFQVDPLKAFTWGYAQDHQLYLLPDTMDGEKPPFPGITLDRPLSEFPPRAFSYLRGGYESSLSSWGYRAGDFFVARTTDAWERMSNESSEKSSLPPLFYTPVEQPAFPVDVTLAAGTIIQALPAQVMRGRPVEFSWVGGDPGAEMPQSPRVVLERLQGNGSYAPITTTSGAPYDNRGNRFITRRRLPDPTDWQWVVTWEELHDFPVGTYRLAVTGHHLTGAGRTEYTLNSAPFDVMAMDNLVVTAAVDARTITGTLSYPAAERFRMNKTNQDPGRFIGSFRMRHVDVPEGLPTPLVPMADVDASGVHVRLLTGTTEVAAFDATTLDERRETVGGAANIPVTHYVAMVPTSVAAGDYTAEVTVTDAHGNTGAFSGTLTIP